MLPLDSYPIPNPTIVSRLLEGEAVLVLPEAGKVEVLNDVGARIWVLADGSRSIREIAEALCQEYQVEFLQAQEDACRFIHSLVQRDVYQLALQPLASTGGSSRQR